MHGGKEGGKQKRGRERRRNGGVEDGGEKREGKSEGGGMGKGRTTNCTALKAQSFRLRVMLLMRPCKLARENAGFGSWWMKKQRQEEAMERLCDDRLDYVAKKII